MSLIFSLHCHDVDLKSRFSQSCPGGLRVLETSRGSTSAYLVSRVKCKNVGLALPINLDAKIRLKKNGNKIFDYFVFQWEMVVLRQKVLSFLIQMVKVFGKNFCQRVL
uniref:Uncharacterized protein n=1 Tax=Pararge aegeria TaxID=116150 RepID=S4PG59_9NEOP